MSGLSEKITVTLNTKYITGNLFGYGYNTLVTHGVPLSKLLTFSVFVNGGNGLYPQGYSYSGGYGFQTFIDASYVHINPVINSAQYVYGQSFLIYIVYTS